MKDVAYSRAALKTLSRLPRPTAVRIREKIDAYAIDPAPLANNVKALKEAGGAIRLRIGEWRVIMRESGDAIAVIRIGARGDVYRR